MPSLAGLRRREYAGGGGRGEGDPSTIEFGERLNRRDKQHWWALRNIEAVGRSRQSGSECDAGRIFLGNEHNSTWAWWHQNERFNESVGTWPGFCVWVILCEPIITIRGLSEMKNKTQGDLFDEDNIRMLIIQVPPLVTE
jgi:hypothetical protein